MSHKIDGTSYSLFSIANPLFFRISAIVTTVAIAVTILPNNVSKINTSTYRKGETLEEWKLSFSRNAYFFKDNIYTSSIDKVLFNFFERFSRQGFDWLLFILLFESGSKMVCLVI